MQFSADEVELLLEIAREGASGCTFLERVNHVADALAALVPFSTVSAFLLNESQTGAPPAGHVLFRDRSPQALIEYAQHYLSIDPMAVTFPEGKGVPYLLSDFARGRQFGKDAFTSDFMPGLGIRHIMALGHRMPGGEMLSFAIHRGKELKDFSEHERELMRIISPDLKRAIHDVLVNERINALKGQATTARAGALVFDEQGDLLHADPAALSLAERLPGRGRGPLDPFLATVRQLLSLGTDGPVSAERVMSIGDGSWLLSRYSMSTRVPRSVIVMLELLEPGTQAHFDAIADRARLTPRERSVVAKAIKGLGNRQIGLELKLSTVTVGVHLTQIYRKVGVAGRNELTTMFLGGSGAAPRRRLGR